MNIQTEADLVTELAQGLKQQFHTDIVIKEFAGGYGIADLAFARNFLTSENRVNRVPINNYFALGFSSFLAPHWHSIASLSLRYSTK